MKKAILALFTICMCFLGRNAFAYFSFDLGLSEELYVKPGDIVNIPARFYNSGTDIIEFRTIWNYDDVGKFVNQFNGVILNPGEYFDFTFCSLSISPDAPLNERQDGFLRMLSVGFPGNVALESGHYGLLPPGGTDPYAFTNIIISNETFITPLDRYTTGQPGYFGPGGNDKALIRGIQYGNFDFGTGQLSPNPDGFIPEIRNIEPVPEPATFSLLGLGLAGLALRKKKRV